MADEIIDFRKAKVEREDDNTKITPRELMDLMVRDFDNDGLDGKPIKMVAIVELELPDGRRQYVRFRAGSTRYEELAMIDLAKHFHIRDWIRSGEDDR